MPNGPDDFDEEEFRQPAVDVDVVIKLDELRSSIDGISEELKQLHQIDRGLDEIGHLVNESRSTLQSIRFRATTCLVVIVVGIVVILATLRHWF